MLLEGNETSETLLTSLESAGFHPISELSAGVLSNSGEAGITGIPLKGNHPEPMNFPLGSGLKPKRSRNLSTDL